MLEKFSQQVDFLFGGVGHGTVRRHFSYLKLGRRDRAKTQLLSAFVYFAVFLVVVGCLSSFGNELSTKQAQTGDTLFFPVPAVYSSRPYRHPKKPNANRAASYSRFSSEMQDASSIEQQQRRCRDKATANGHKIAPHLQFCDEAVSGTKKHRKGLDALMEAAAEGEFDVLYFDCLSRLARDLMITISTLRTLVYKYEVRIISVSEGVDSINGNWEFLALFRGWMHQEYIKILRDAVMRGKEGAILKGWSVGDYTLGYTSIPIEGSESTRPGRDKTKPRMRVIIHEEHADCIRRIFNWFILDRKSISWIARELNRLGAPKDHRSSSPRWTQQLAKSKLRNSKYIGIWPWGRKKNVRDTETGRVSQEDRPPHEAAKWERFCPDLRIIDDETFHKVQALLDENDARCAEYRKSDNGKFTGSTSRGHLRSHLLQEIVFCKCGEPFHVNGTNGQYMCCKGYLDGVCKSRTRVKRKLAEKMILAAVSERILRSKVWIDAILKATLLSWTQQQQTNPGLLQSLERRLQELGQKITRLLDRLEESDQDPLIAARLGERRAEKNDCERQLAKLRQSAEDRPVQPTNEWVLEKLQKLEEVLNGDPRPAAYALGALVGEKIILEEFERPGRKRKGIRGTFTIDLSSAANALDTAIGDSVKPALSETIVIDFIQSMPWEDVADRVKNLFDQGLPDAEIAKRLGCVKCWIPKALKVWCAANGVSYDELRKGRSPQRKKPTKAMIIADEAKKRWDKGDLMKDIAAVLTIKFKMNVCVDDVTDAIAYWHTSRGLPVPDGRTRRKSLGDNDRAA